MAETREQSEYWAELAEEIIQTEPLVEYLQFRNFTIIYLTSEHKRKSNGKAVHGLTEIVQEKNKWSMPGDVSITIYEANNEGFTKEQERILMLHELMHIQVDGENNNKPKLRGHDVEDFSEIIEMYGMDWAHVDDKKMPGQMTLQDINNEAGANKTDQLFTTDKKQ